MGRNYLAALKLAFALVCVGLAILVVAHWTEILPGASDTAARRRHDFVDTITTLSVDDISQSRWADIRQRFQRVVDRRQDLLSIGIRSSIGELKASTRRHDEIWNTDRSFAMLKGRSSSSGATVHQGSDELDPIVVSLTIHKRMWGQMEFAFAKQSIAGESWFGSPLARLLIFFSICGTTIYFCFVIRVLGVFKQTQVVPNDVRVALDTLAEGLLLLDGQSRILFANQAFAKSVDSSPRLLEGSSVDDLPWKNHRGDEEDPSTDFADDSASAQELLRPWKEAAKEGNQQSGTMLELDGRQSHPTVFSINVTPLQSGAKVDPTRGVLVTFRDVTLEQRHKNELQEMLRLLGDSRDEIEQKNKRLEILATRDSLTGCLNRRAFFERFDSIWATSKRDELNLAVLMIDIDHFKSVNDTYGHHTGDEVLRAVSAVLRKHHEEDGIVCRYGGEEFCVLLPNTDVEAAAELAEQTRIAISKLVFDDPSELRLTASLGISELRFDPVDPQSLINQADACLYVAKREGRNRVVVYNPSMTGEPEETEVKLGVDESHRLPAIAIGVLTRTLSRRNPKLAQISRRAANNALRWTEGLLDQTSRYLLEIGLLLHRVDSLASDEKISKSQAEEDQLDGPSRLRLSIDPQTSQEIIDGLDNEYLSCLMRDFLCLINNLANGAEPEVASQRTPESQWMLLAALFEMTNGDHRKRVDQTLQWTSRHIDAEICNQWRLNALPLDDVTRGVLQLQKYMSETIATEINAVQSAVQNKDFEQLSTKLANLRSFSSDSNLSAIQNAIDAISGEADISVQQYLQTLDERDRWAEMETKMDSLETTCLNIQAELLAFSMEISHTTTALNISDS